MLYRWSMADATRDTDAPKERPFDTAPLDGPSTGGPAVAYLNQLLAKGRPDPATVAKLIRAFAHTGVGHELYAMIQAKLGNAYVQEVIAILREPAIHRDAAHGADEHHKYAVLAGAAEKPADPRYPDPPGFPGVDNFSQDFLQALPFFVENGYQTSVLYGNAPQPVAPAQAAGLAEVTKEAGATPSVFSRESLIGEMARISAAIQPGDEVMLMIATHGYDKAEGESITSNWHDPTSGHYAFQLPSGQMHLDELAPYRDLIEKRGGKLAVLLLTCDSQYGLEFASASGNTTVISETGTDKGDGDFAASFLSNLEAGMTLEQAFAMGKQMMVQNTADAPHISSETTHKPSNFKL
jgi:hypothetical protein